MKQPMKWNKNCRIGIDDIDSQHRLLFAISSELLDFQNLEEEGPEFKYLFDHLRKYVQDHFAFEESFMEDIEYPDREDHLKLHEEIIREINDTLRSTIDFSSLRAKMEMLLGKWIREHILMADKQYAEWYHLRKGKS